MAIATAGLGLMTALLLGRNRRCRFGAKWRRGMQRARTTKTSRSAGRRAHARSPHHGLAGTNGAAIDRLAGYRRRTARGHSGPRRLRRSLAGHRTSLLLLLQARH